MSVEPARSWDDYDVVPREAIDGNRLIELPDGSGWFLLVAWVAGPSRVRRCLAPDEPPDVRVVCHGPSGTVRYSRRPTDEEEQEYYDMVAGWLSDAGVPAPPQGFCWWLDVSDRFSSAPEFWSALNASVDVVAPWEVRPALDRFLHEALTGSS